MTQKPNIPRLADVYAASRSANGLQPNDPRYNPDAQQVPATVQEQIDATQREKARVDMPYVATKAPGIVTNRPFKIPTWNEVWSKSRTEG